MNISDAKLHAALKELRDSDYAGLDKSIQLVE
jgi:hypothetical protein